MYVFELMYIYIYIYIILNWYIYIHICVYVYVYIYIYIYIYVYVCVCMYTYIIQLSKYIIISLFKSHIPCRYFSPLSLGSFKPTPRPWSASVKASFWRPECRTAWLQRHGGINLLPWRCSRCSNGQGLNTRKYANVFHCFPERMCEMYWNVWRGRLGFNMFELEVSSPSRCTSMHIDAPSCQLGRPLASPARLRTPS